MVFTTSESCTSLSSFADPAAAVKRYVLVADLMVSVSPFTEWTKSVSFNATASAPLSSFGTNATPSRDTSRRPRQLPMRWRCTRLNDFRAAAGSRGGGTRRRDDGCSAGVRRHRCLTLRQRRCGSAFVAASRERAVRRCLGRVLDGNGRGTLVDSVPPLEQGNHACRCQDPQHGPRNEQPSACRGELPSLRWLSASFANRRRRHRVVSGMFLKWCETCLQKVGRPVGVKRFREEVPLCGLAL